MKTVAVREITDSWVIRLKVVTTYSSMNGHDNSICWRDNSNLLK